MKILVTTENGNPYTREIFSGLSSAFNVLSGVAPFFAKEDNFDIIHIQWPEELLNWQSPTSQQLETVVEQLNYWRSRGSKLVVTRHNDLPHKADAEKYKPLYDAIYANADAIIHLGEYSLHHFIRYTNAMQKVIAHHVYESYPNAGNKKDARKQLGIKQDAKVVLCFGNIRNKEEQLLINEVFDKLCVKGKYLLAPRFLSIEIKDRFTKLVVILKSLFNKLFRSKWIGYSVVPEEKVSTFFNAADVVFVPRVSNLNSGVPFLAFAFGKVATGPGTGNIKEVLMSMNCPLFEPQDKSDIVEKIKEAFVEAERPGKSEEIRMLGKQLYSLGSAIKEHEKLYKELV